MTFKTFRGKKAALIGKVDFREFAKMCICRMYTIDRSEVIKIFHLFLYSIKINLLKHVLWDKMWSRTIVEVNRNWNMPKILKLQKLYVVMALSICWTYLSDVPIDDVKKSCTNRPILGLSVDNRISFQNHFNFLNLNSFGHL